MKNIKAQMLKLSRGLPASADIEDVMYQLYVLDKIQTGRTAAAKGHVTSIQKLTATIETW